MGTSTDASELECAFGVVPTDLKPLTSRAPYVPAQGNSGTSYASGLYPGSSNQMPAAHRMKGESIAATIVPLDSNGDPDTENGEIVILAEGMSNTLLEMDALNREFLASNPLVNPKIRFINVSEASCSLVCWSTRSQGSQDPQVQVVLLKHSNNRPQRSDGTPIIADSPFVSREDKFFPGHALVTKRMLKERLVTLKKKYPNLKLAYFSSRAFGGWACSPSGDQYREPVAFEEGFSVKWLIEDQIQSADPDLEFEGADPPAPWIAWGPYTWDSATPRDTFQRDGTHPCPSGARTLARAWYDFLMTEQTATPWFRADAAVAVETGEAQPPSAFFLSDAYPNPFRQHTALSFFSPVPAYAEVRIYTVSGALVRTIFTGALRAGSSQFAWDGRNAEGEPASAGVYFVRARSMGKATVGKLFKLK